MAAVRVWMARRRWRIGAALVLAGALLMAAFASRQAAVGAAASAPRAAGPVADADPSAPVTDRVEDLLKRMTLDEKIGQMTMVARDGLVTEADITRYHLGSLLSGGGSSPTPNTPAAWADMIDRYQRAALATRLKIPIVYGVDAVHGHNNVHGATIYPHNIGLGATRDPELVRAIARATAEEVTGTGPHWNFAPCVCVARNERWGRTYESFGEDPEIPVAMTTAIDGYQGKDLSGPTSLIATAKHYVGDGGTEGGDDQGDTRISEAELRRIHLPPFKAAVDRGVASVMITFSSWNGVKVHGHRYLVTDVLKGELGFKGVVVSDWAGIDQLPGDRATQVRTAVNAGIDVIMLPEGYREFIPTLRAEVQAGRVPMERVNDAVRRLLTKKFELGVFEQPLAERRWLATVGSAEHRALGRQAVARSATLLKNDNGTLPLRKGGRLFVAGKNANDIGNQSGGWTIEWQGKSGDITPGTTILEGIRQVAGQGTQVTHDRAGNGVDRGFDAAVVVVGETPYAEFEGDRTDDLRLDAEDRATLARVRAAGIPVVVVLVSGRPLVVTEELPGWDALIAAWLPGTEGAGIADVLFGDHNPTAKLPMSWPRSAAQVPVNVGDPSYDPLFPYGFGLSYK